MAARNQPDFLIQGYGGWTYDRRTWLTMLHRASTLTAEEIARRAGLAPNHVRTILSGKIADPEIETLQGIAASLGEGVWAAFGYTPLGWRRGRVDTVIDYAGSDPVEMPPCIVCGEPLPNRIGGKRIHPGWCHRQHTLRARRINSKRRAAMREEAAR